MTKYIKGETDSVSIQILKECLIYSRGLMKDKKHEKSCSWKEHRKITNYEAPTNAV